MKNKTAGIAIKEFVGLKAKIYSFLVDDSSEGKKAKGMNKNVAITSIINTPSRIQSKHRRIETYEIKKVSLSCFDNKIFIQNNGYDGLALGYQG